MKIDKSELAKHSKFLSYVLRHKPDSINIQLDDNGWVDVSVLLEALTAAGKNITLELLAEIVEKNDKKRFAFSEDGNRIRANQGHSIVEVNLQLERIQPPEILYHGTVERYMDDIQESGLQKMNRHHVHLSEIIETATNVGSRRGKPILLIVKAGLMHEEGFAFYRSENGVWLTDNVPWEYLKRLSQKRIKTKGQ